MGTTRTDYAADFEVPDLLQQDLTTTLTCPVIRDAARASVTSGTITIYRRDRTKFVDAGDVVVTTPTLPSYEVTSAALSDEAVEAGWEAEWTLVISGETHVFQNEVQVVLRAPHPPISDHMLTDRYTKLGRALAGTGETSFQRWIDLAWVGLQRWLISLGNRPALIVRSYELIELHTAWSMWIIFDDNAHLADPEGQWEARRKSWFDHLEHLKGTTSFTYDSDDDGDPDIERRASQPVTWIGSPGPIGGHAFTHDPDPWGYP